MRPLKNSKNGGSDSERNIFKCLALHLNDLPGGYPSTKSGVELKILKLLFSKSEAKLAVHLTLLSEEAAIIARRAGLSAVEAARRLEAMAKKGLIFRSKREGKRPQYMAAQFVVGIWELQVDRLTPELSRYMGEYLPYLMEVETWRKAPQMRVVPIEKSLDASLEVMTYENAAELVKEKDRFVITDCICRKERQMDGEGCNKPLETCISFGGVEDFFLKTGAGREVTREKVLEILEQAERAGLVLQPSNGKNINWICCCCGCCCAVLRTLGTYPDPASIIASPFTVIFDPASCKRCGICVKRCQMNALVLEADQIRFSAQRCIGCGLCVSTCSPGSLTLVRKKSHEINKVPRNIVSASLLLSWKRRKITPLLKRAARGYISKYF